MKKNTALNIGSGASLRTRAAFWLTVALLLTFALTPRGYAQSVEETVTYPYTKTFVISGYYSPLPDQSRYYRGTYEAELKLQGNGTHGADGTPVYVGMIAAPPTFKFGTKLEIPGLGVGTVHDRGGAIQGNRLDVWMGTGEEGLQRAFGWGMRTVDVTVYGPDSAVVENLNFDSVPLMTLSWIGSPARKAYFKSDLGLGSTGEDVRELQSLLKDFGWYMGELTGLYDSTTEQAILKFQLHEGVISSSSSTGAGNFGPRTRYAFEAKYDLTGPSNIVASASQSLPSNTVAETPVVVAPVAAPVLQNVFTTPMSRGDQGEQVTLLQEELARLNFLGIDSTGNYGEVTEHAVFKFQQAFGLIQNEDDSGAGSVGPRTLEKLNQLVNARKQNEVATLAAAEKKEIVQDRVKTEREIVTASLAAQTHFVTDLPFGSRGPDVERVQQVLKVLGFYTSQLTSEYFGEVTKKAITAFQESHNIEPTGNVDAATRSVINQILGL